MKRIYLTFFLIALIVSAKAQVLINEGFEGATFPPPGWTIINGAAPEGNNWRSSLHPTLPDHPVHSGEKSMVYEFDKETAAQAWAITSPANLQAGVTYILTFYYAVGDADYPEKMKVTVGNSPTIAAQTITLWNNDEKLELTDTAWTLARIEYSPTTSGDFYFGFNCYSEPDRFAMLVDDVRLQVRAENVPNCTSAILPAVGATNVSAPQTIISWNSQAADSYDFYFGTTTNLDSIGNTIDTVRVLSGLAYNTTYYWSVVPKGLAGSPTSCPINTFVTQAQPPVPDNNDCSNATEIGLAPITGSTKRATQSRVADSCGNFIGNANDDVWYKFTTSRAGDASITLTPDATFDATMIGYSGTCGTLTKITCADDFFTGSETLVFTNLAAATTYYFRVFSFGGPGEEGNFTVTVTGTALPVRFSNLKGERNGSRNIFSWTTETEQNNKGFELQRSVDGTNFSTLSFVNTKAQNGNSASPIKYQFEDNTPFISTAYYRLKQVEKDGKETISNIVSIKGLRTANIVLSSVYPNPAKSEVKVVISAPSNDRVNFVITDLAGKAVMQQAKQVVAGDNNLSFQVDQLLPGSYLIKATCARGCESAVSKFVKQ